MDKKRIKKELLLLGLVASLTATGCGGKKEKVEQESFSFTKNIDDKGVYRDNRLDVLLRLKPVESLKSHEDNLNCDYLIDIQNLTKEDIYRIYKNGNYLIPGYLTFATLVDEKTVTDEIKAQDGKMTLTRRSFETGSILNSIIYADDLAMQILPAYTHYYRHEANCKKLLSMDGRVFYYITSKAFVGKSRKQYVNDLEPGEMYECSNLYEYQRNNGKEEFLLLYRNQIGINNDSEMVSQANFNNASEVVIPVSETIFKDREGTHSVSDLEDELKRTLTK